MFDFGFDFGKIAQNAETLKERLERIAQTSEISARLDVYRDCPYDFGSVASIGDRCPICLAPASWHKIGSSTEG